MNVLILANIAQGIDVQLWAVVVHGDAVPETEQVEML
jgi:hypothetical protein